MLHNCIQTAGRTSASVRTDYGGGVQGGFMGGGGSNEISKAAAEKEKNAVLVLFSAGK